MQENLKKILLKYRDLVPKKLFERDLRLYTHKFDKANIIIGPRRAGKTYFLYSLIAKEKNPIFINFEDNLLINISRADLNEIPDLSKELFGKENLSFFFDELQSLKAWENFIVSLLSEHFPVYITGSNSKLLSKEISTSLRGKSLPYLLLPLSFKEFIKLKNITLDKNFLYSDKVFEIKRFFQEYHTYGGFPEIVLSESIELKNKLINNYFDSVLYKDLVDRLNLKNIKLVEITIKYLLNLFGNTFSIAKFERYLKSNKIPYSMEDLYKILKSLEDVFMIGYVRQFYKSARKTEYSKSKIYLFDPAYIHFLSGEPNDFGRVLENIVFIELFRKAGNIENKTIFYYQSDKGEECDFIITKRDRVSELIQVTQQINDKNKERELNGILNAMNFFKVSEGTILTLDQEEKMKIENKDIYIMPIWKWLLAQEEQQ